MRERWARGLAILTGVLVLLLALAFSVTQNRPGSTPVVALAQTAVEAPVATAMQIEWGRRVYDEQGCARCHSIAGRGSPRSPLDGVGARLGGAEIRQWIIAADEVKDDLSPRALAAKAPFGELPDEQLDALVAYLKSLGND